MVTVVALPGFTRGPQHLQRFADACRSRGYDCTPTALAPRWLPVLYMNRRHLRSVAERLHASINGPMVIAGHSAGAAAGTYLASYLASRGAAVRGLVLIDGVDSPNHLIAENLGSLSGMPVRAVLAPPSPCNRSGALEEFLAAYPWVDVTVVPGAGHGDIEGAGIGVYRRACRDSSDQATADHFLAAVLEAVASMAAV